MTRAPVRSARRAEAAPPRRVSHRHDATERQADKAADIVARGGSVTGWAFAGVPAEASVHRDEEEPKKPPEAPVKLDDKPKSQGESYAEAGGKVAEALLQTKAGQAVQDGITSSKPLTGAIGVGMLAMGKEVPIPLGKGVTLGVRIDGLTEGKVNSAGLTLTFGGGTPKKTAATPVIDRDSQRLMESIRAQTDPQPAYAPPLRGLPVLESTKKKPPSTAPSGSGWTFSPLAPAAPGPAAQPTPQTEATEKPGDVKKDDEVQRAPATASEALRAAEYDTSGVDAATRGGGRAIDPALRHSMEARFGYDFSSVRLHDDSQAASAAGGVDAAAFTVGEHIVFGTGRFDPSSPEGRRLLAHELAHVVQQRGGAGPRSTGAPARVQRKPRAEEATTGSVQLSMWSDDELHAYLSARDVTGEIEGDWMSRSKARAVVRKWKAGTPGWELSARRMSLVVRELLDALPGPGIDSADGEAIFDLLERSETGHLREVFREPKELIAKIDRLGWEAHFRLLVLADARFEGGIEALRRGEVATKGAPFPADSPVFAFDPSALEQRLDGTHRVDEILALIERFSAADRRLAFDHLRNTSWPRAAADYGTATQLLGTASDSERPAVEARQKSADRKLRTLKAVIGEDFVSELPASRELLASTTAPVDADKREELTLALAPQTYDTSQGNVIEFDDPPPKSEPTASPKTTQAPAPAPAPKQTEAERRAEARRVAAEKKAAEAEAERKFGPESAYRKDLEAAIRTIIDKQFEDNVTNVGTRKAMSEVEGIAAAAERETNAVFGAYYRKKSDVGPGDRSREKIHGLTVESDKVRGNVRSWFTEYDSRVRPLDLVTRRTFAMNWLRRYFQSEDQIRTVNGTHGAKPAFTAADVATNVEGRTQQLVAREVTKEGATAKGLDDPRTIVDKLLVIKRNWVGMAGRAEVSVNLFETGDAEKDRAARWTMLQVLVHEYLHTLRHADYEAYAMGFGRQSVQYNTLVEGVDEVLTAMVWSRIAAELESLRPEVEGLAYADLPPQAVPPPIHYDSIAEAYRIIASVGLPALAAAYFLGKVDRIRPPAGGTK